MLNDNIPQEALDYFLDKNLSKEGSTIWDIGENKGFGAAQQYWDDYVLKNKDKMITDLMNEYRLSSKASPSQKVRTFYGAPEMWEGEIRPDIARYDNPSTKNHSLNRFTTTPDLDVAREYMKGNSFGDIYAFDINPDDFYKAGVPFSQQSPKVQKAILTDIISNPNSVFGPSGGLRNANFVNDFEAGQALNKYGILGEYTDNMYTFANPSQVPTGGTTMQGTIVLEDNLPKVGRVPSNPIPTSTYTRQPSINDILQEIAIGKNLKTPQLGYHAGGALFSRYDPAFAYTGEGAQAYGQGMYSGSVPEVADEYMDMYRRRGQIGYKYTLGLPEQYKYYNTDLPSTQQSDWVKAKLGNVTKGTGGSEPLDILSFRSAIARNGRFDNLYDEFIKAKGYAPKYTSEMVDFANENLDLFPEPLYDRFIGHGQAKYDELGKVLREKGIVGTTHAGTNGAHINVTFNPDDIIVTGPNGYSMPKVADAGSVNKTFGQMLKGYKKAFDPINRVIIQNPYIKPALKALGTSLGVIGTAGDAAMIYEAGKYAKKKMIEDYDNLPIEQKQLIGNHIGMNPRTGQDWKGLNLPLVQINNDGSPNVTLQGGVNYDNYMLEPLGDDVYIRRKINK